MAPRRRRCGGVGGPGGVALSWSPHDLHGFMARLAWEAPALVDIDLAHQTHGGGTVFSDETTYNCCTPYNFEGEPLS